MVEFKDRSLVLVPNTEAWVEEEGRMHSVRVEEGFILDQCLMSWQLFAPLTP